MLKSILLDGVQSDFKQHLKTLVKTFAITLVLFSLTAQTVVASGLEDLKVFYESTDAMSAHFKQTVSDGKGRKIQQVEGSMMLKRPNLFRWDYNKPYEQQIVSDGKQVFLYDTELEQVTIRTLSQALGSSPAALLAGGAGVEQAFKLKEVSRKDTLSWVLATPKNKDSGFDRVFLGFEEGQLKAMEMLDSFGQTTQISFSQVNFNPALKLEQFLFKMPKGVDVVGE